MNQYAFSRNSFKIKPSLKKDTALRFYFLCCLCLATLTGCVNYYGMKSHATLQDAETLSKPTTYKIPNSNASAATNGWWRRFHDPQLNQLIAVALANSPTMQMAANRLEKTQQLRTAASASLWPSVDASGYLTRERFAKFGIVPPPFNGKIFNIGDVGLNFNYEFDFWGKNRQLVAAQVSEQYAAQADLAQARLVLSAAVASSYFQLQNNKRQWQIAQQIVHKTKEISTVIQYRTQHGVDSDLPVTTALTDVESAQLIAAQYEAEVKFSLAELAVLLGKNPAVTQIDTSALAKRPEDVTLPSTLPANLLAQRPDIQAARSRVEAAAHHINVAKARLFPNINLTGLFSYQSIFLNNLFTQQNQNNAISGAIDLPLFDAGARRANVGVRYAEYDLAVNTYNQTLLSALHEVIDQETLLNSLRKQLQAQNRAVLATNKKYRLTTSRYHHGIVDYVQVLEIKNTLLQQQATQLDLQARHLRAIVAMLKALGGNTT